MKQLLPKLKKINCKKLISKKKSQIDRATCVLISILILTIEDQKLELERADCDKMQSKDQKLVMGFVQ